MKPFVSSIAGGAGFVGANLIPRLLAEGRVVVVADNMSRGKEEYALRAAAGSPERVVILQGDCTDADFVEEAFAKARGLGVIDEVWHLAANSDIPAGVNDAQVDLKDTFMTTFRLLGAMKLFEVATLHFASSSAIYGDRGDLVLHENVGPLLPISNYGAMKLASEAAISAAAESFLDRANIFRFPNVVGVPATHGVIFDFVHKLIADPSALAVLGDGTQQKAYLHAQDLIGAMLIIRDRQTTDRTNIVNIGPTDEGVTVRWIAEQVVARVSPTAAIHYGKGNKGWVGDVPKFSYSTERLQSYGWKPALGSADAIRLAVDQIATQLGR